MVFSRFLGEIEILESFRAPPALAEVSLCWRGEKPHLERLSWSSAVSWSQPLPCVPVGAQLSAPAWFVLFAWAFLCPVQSREFRAFPWEAQGVLVWDVEPGSPRVWDDARPWVRVLGELICRFVRVWKLKCLKLIPVLGREKKQMMGFIIGGKCKGCFQEALVTEPIILGQGQALLCSPGGTLRCPTLYLPGTALN